MTCMRGMVLRMSEWSAEPGERHKFGERVLTTFLGRKRKGEKGGHRAKIVRFCQGMRNTKILQFLIFWSLNLLLSSPDLPVMDVRTKIKDVCAKMVVFLRPCWWGEAFDSWALPRKCQDLPIERSGPNNLGKWHTNKTFCSGEGAADPGTSGRYPDWTGQKSSQVLLETHLSSG